MVVKYYEPIMDEIEQKKCVNFVGYLNPRGQLIDYTTLIGYQTHYSTKNPASMMFLRFISYVMKGYSPNELKFFWDEDGHVYKNNKTKGYKYVVKRGFDYFHEYNVCSYDTFIQDLNKCYASWQSFLTDHINSKKHSFWEMHVYDNLQNDIVRFFKKVYENGDFFKAIGKIIQIENICDYLKLHKEQTKGYDYESEKDFYNDYQIAELMSYFKDIMVQYLGYDSIERRIKINNNKSLKIITTSCSNPNERFYNWILMDWIVQRIPKMYWNEHDKKYVLESKLMSYYQSEKEEILEKEINSIKSILPIEQRKLYLRK